MALFVLKEGYRVVTTDSGGVVVHARTGDSLDLTPAEVFLLARATTGTVDSDDPGMRPLVRKLAGLGVLVQTAAATTPAPAAPESKTPAKPAIAPAGTMGPDETVPVFRLDLALVSRPSAGVFDVTDPTSGKMFTLYDFEVSLARMLDGHRRVADVLEAGQRIGIPVDLKSLSQFIRQLERYRFLDRPGLATLLVREDSGRPPREKWDEGIRTLFQSGLRMTRQGHYAEAAKYFEALLEQEPDNPEAVEMLAQVRQRIASGAPVVAALPDLPLVPGEVSGGQPSEPVPPAVDDFSVAEEGEPVTMYGPQVAGSEAVTDPVGASLVARLSGRRRLLVGVAAGAVAVAIGLLWWQLSTSPPRLPVEKVLGPAAAAKVPAGAGQELEVPGAWVVGADAGPADAADAAWPPDAAAPDAGAAADAGRGDATVTPEAPAVEEVEPRRGAVQDGGAAVDAGAAAEVPKAAPAKAEEGAEIAWVTVAIARRGRVTMAQVRAPADGVLAWEVEAEKPVARGKRVGVVRGGEQPLTALKAGLLIPIVAGSAQVKSGDLLANVVYVEAYLKALVAGATPAQDWLCEVVDDAKARRAPCKIVEVAPRAGGVEITATTEPLWFDAAREARVRVAPP